MHVPAFIYFVNSKYFLLHAELTSERKVYDFDYYVTIQETETYVLWQHILYAGLTVITRILII